MAGPVVESKREKKRCQMNGNFKKFLTEDVRRFSPAGGYAALAVFGKHPGWDDFIEPTTEVTKDDLGLETESLNLVKTVFLVNGIGGQIDSGAWEALEPAQQLPAFGHLLVWQRSGQIIIGRLWSSSDGKGRKRYPMIVCAHLFGVTLEWAVKNALPVLKSVEDGCIEATTAADVRRIVLRARFALRAAIESADDKGEYSPVPQAVLQGILRPPGAASPEAFLRVLYQVEGQLGPFFTGAGKSRSTPPTTLAQQVRVPAVGSGPEQSFLFWTKFFLKLVDPSFPVLITIPLGQAWVDVTVGEPESQQFFCLRATPKALPLSSEVPYKLDDSFRAKAAKYLDDLYQGGNPSYQIESQSGAGVEEPPPAKGGIFKWFGVIIVLILAGVGVMLIMPNGDKHADAPSVSGAAKTEEKQKGDATLAAAERKKAEAIATAAKLKADTDAAIKEKLRQTEDAARQTEAKKKAEAEEALKQKERQEAEAARLLEEKKKADIAAAEAAARQAEADKKAAAIAAAAKLKADADAAAQKAALAHLPPTAQPVTNPVSIAHPQIVPNVQAAVSSAITSNSVMVTGFSASPTNATPVSGISELTNSIGMIMAQLPSGLWVSKYEVTQAQYRQVMGSNPSKFVNDLQPVEDVSWYDAIAFCRKLTEKENGRMPAGTVYTLPTEKQWIELSGDQKFDDLPAGITKKLSPPLVGSSGVVNKYGLNDVLGSVWEWCLDDAANGSKLLKGGAFNSANFDRLLDPNQSAANCGFRCIIIKL